MAQQKTQRELLFKNQYTGAKQQKIQRIKDFGDTPFPNSNSIKKRTILASDFNEQFKDVVEDVNVKHTLVGRIKLHRKGGKSGFINIVDDSGIVQGFASIEDTKNYDVFKLHLDVGDIVSMTGHPFKTNTGEITLKIKKINVVAKSTGTPIGKHAGLQDDETKYRKRYLDMIANEEVRKKLMIRSMIITIIRKFMDKNDIIEVETPMMHPTAGGANAKPFITYHNAMDVERFLRIAPELYLKRLVVGGMENVFEINRNFRNEGVDATHNPEFTSIEFYQAYKTYEDHMKMTEKMFKKIYRKIFDNKDYILPYGDLEINLNNLRFDEVNLKSDTVGENPFKTVSKSLI